VFLCFSMIDVLNSMRAKYENLPTASSHFRTFWTFCFLTLLPSYLINPISSAKILPDPASNIAMFRTPPESTLMLFSSAFLSIIACCVLGSTCCFVRQGSDVHETFGHTYTYCMACNDCLVLVPAIIVVYAYVKMGNFFFIDWEFKFSMDLTFVAAAMVAKLFLGAASVLDFIAFLIDSCKNICKAKDYAGQAKEYVEEQTRK